MRNVLVLMTALVPTEGHRNLIDFASLLPDSQVYVLIAGRTFEPVPLKTRVDTVSQQFNNRCNVHVRGHVNDYAPQEPKDSINFWPWWKKEISNAIPEVANWSTVVASEMYGDVLARTLNAEFLSYDCERTLNSISGTVVREDPWTHWGEIIKPFRQQYMLTATLFGQESVGKSTLTKNVSEKLKIKTIFEYARPHLEIVGTYVNDGVMDQIYRGQFALQQQALKQAATPVLLQDTDLYSTVGYWPIMKQNIPKDLEIAAEKLKSNIYFLLPDDCAFVPDAQRYGIDKRESSYNYWKDLLDNYELNYVEVPAGSLEVKEKFIIDEIENMWAAHWSAIKQFDRNVTKEEK